MYGYRGWIGVDFDGTLAQEGQGSYPEPAPVPEMVERVREWHKQGIEVRVFTARAVDKNPAQGLYIADWCQRHIGFPLEITNQKDRGTIAIWDNIARGVENNTGKEYREERDRLVIQIRSLEKRCAALVHELKAYERNEP